MLGDSRGAQRILAALDAAGDLAPALERARALLLAAWIEASTGDLELAGEHIAAATEVADKMGDSDLQARCAYYRAYVVSHHGEFRRAMELTDRSRAIYDTLDRPWDQAANSLFAARAAISAGDQARSVEAADQVQRWLGLVEDPWLHVRGEAILGELARLHHRFDEAVLHLGRAAERSRELGFQQTEAYQLTSLGRAQCQTGDYEAGSATLDLAIAKARATGDVRLAALAQVHLGRVLRGVGHVAAARAALEPRPPGTATPAVGSKPRSVSACWRPWTLRTTNQGPRSDWWRSSPMRVRATMPLSRCLRSMRSPASQTKLTTPGQLETCAWRRIGAWAQPPTSSPTSTESTRTRYEVRAVVPGGREDGRAAPRDRVPGSSR